MSLDTKAARLEALGLDGALVLDGSARGVGTCRSCGRKVALLRGVYCPSCGSNAGVRETP